MARGYTIFELREMLKQLPLPIDSRSAEYERVWIQRLKIHRMIHAAARRIFYSLKSEE